MNIPFQNECNKSKIKKTNPLLISETFSKNQEHSIYGIYNIKEIFSIFPQIPLNNEIYNKYYDIFGNIIDYLNNNYENEEENEQQNFVNECLIKLEKYFKELYIINFLSNTMHDENITLSQLKTRLGIITSYYLYIIKKKALKYMQDEEDFIEPLISIISLIIKKKEHLSYIQILRIFITLTRRIIESGNNPKLLVLTSKNSNSPYYLAQEFNLEEIKYMNEYSRFFQAYLQMDSYILYNYNLDNMSYSFSIEPIFILKKHLIPNYENFLILQDENNNIIAWTESDVQITTINTKNFFARELFITSAQILDDEKIKKGITFGISIILRHEKNFLPKKILKNNSSIYFCDNGKNKKILYKTGKGLRFGEDGNIIESFLTENREILTSLAKDFIYGELLDYHLFISNDFELLINKIKDIMKKNEVYFKSFPINNPDFSHVTIEEKEEFKNNKDSDITKEEVLNAIKYNKVRIGCEVYTISMIKERILLAIKLDRYDYLPTIIKKIDDELFRFKK